MTDLCGQSLRGFCGGKQQACQPCDKFFHWEVDSFVAICAVFTAVTSITGKPIIERTKSGRSKPVNPLNWWYAQRLAGDEHDRLTQMALDVLTAPGKSYYS
jgi:hypothetical protein